MLTRTQKKSEVGGKKSNIHTGIHFFSLEKSALAAINNPITKYIFFLNTP